MDEKMHFMTDAGELLDWMREHEEFKIINKVEAQMLLDYKIEGLVAPEIADYDFSSMSAIEFAGDKSILSALSMNLALESDTTLRLYFMTSDGSAPTVTVNGEAAEVSENGDGFYVVSINGISADMLDDNVFVAVNGQLTFEVNALDWARIAINDADENVATLANALAVYASCANEVISKN